MTADATPTLEQTFTELPLDFSEYLARRLGKSREVVMSDLGRWLARYERTGCERMGSPSDSTPGVRACRSGVFPASGKAETSPLGRSGAA